MTVCSAPAQVSAGWVRAVKTLPNQGSTGNRTESFQKVSPNFEIIAAHHVQPAGNFIIPETHHLF